MGLPKKNTEQAIKDFIKVHGDLYDYSLVNYQTSKTKVKIICQEHGIFEQTPNNHLNGQHCPKCSKSNASTGVYLIKCLVSGHTKIGISYSAFKRATDIAPISSLEILYWKDFGNYNTAKELEKQLHSQFKEKQVFNNRVRSGGTEFFNLSSDDISYIINHLNKCI